MYKSAFVAGALMFLVLGTSTVTYAQPAGPPYGPLYGSVFEPPPALTSGQPPAGVQVGVVQRGPTAVCRSQQEFRGLLTAYADGNRYRARQAAHACDMLQAGTPVLVMERPAAFDVWQSQTRHRLRYRAVHVRVLNGPARWYTGYMLLDAIR